MADTDHSVLLDMSKASGAALPFILRGLALFMALSIPIVALDSTLYSWHPTLMALGFLGLMTEGLGAIEISKFMKGKRHFHSWHAIIGFVAVMLTYVAALGGGFSFKKLGLLTNLPTPWHGPVKFTHRWLGMITWLLGLVAAYLMLEHHSIFKAKALSLAWQFSLCLVGLAIFVMAVKPSKAPANGYNLLESDMRPMQRKQMAELQESRPLSCPDTT
ncbi:hypothetical protein WJX73_000548 [Symbiochloris irregularis]|uniref:Cytochrome b561 domain-containing protein n=1 Tax=Symbiochloris irregularis TaxID=706552 RepID=A0AAW1PT89_9CHLO